MFLCILLSMVLRDADSGANKRFQQTKKLHLRCTKKKAKGKGEREIEEKHTEYSESKKRSGLDVRLSKAVAFVIKIVK